MKRILYTNSYVSYIVHTLLLLNFCGVRFRELDLFRDFFFFFFLSIFLKSERMGRLRPLKLDLAQALPTPVRRYASPLQRAQYQCQGLMEALLACWKSNEFKDSACKDLISRYDSCIKKEVSLHALCAPEPRSHCPWLSLWAGLASV